MRLVATSDTHEVFDPKKIPEGDVFAHLGDLMVFGYPDEWKARVEMLAALPHKKKYFVPGNHDFHMMLYPGPALQNLRSAGVMVIGLPGNHHYNTVKLPNGMIAYGIPYIIDKPRWAFNSTEEDIRKEIMSTKADMVWSHSPIHGILDWAANGTHGGVRAFKDYQALWEPKVWIHGHIHEAYGYTVYNGTRVFNVCMSDRNHAHVNQPLVLDL